MIDIKVLKAGLEDYTGGESDKTKRFLGYVDSINKKDKHGKDLTFGNSIDDFVKLYIRYNNVGITLDGINAVLAGWNKVFITWVGYKNKVLSVYPESQFDTQLVRENDIFTVAKESGSVVYSHSIADPFASNEGIKGAYCVIKNKRGEFLETLGKDDFDKMKESAMMVSTWNKWESEFWLKSVIKRACKRHFNDVVEEIEKIDNEDYTHESYPKLTHKEKEFSRAESWMNKRFMDEGYDTDKSKEAFIKRVLSKKKVETKQDIDEVTEQLNNESTTYVDPTEALVRDEQLARN